MWRGDKLTLKFLFGNLHSLEKNPKPAGSDKSKINVHKWMMYVSLACDKEQSSKFIDHVVYHLHPTFNPPKVTVSKYPFILARIGWGYFEVHVEVHFKAWAKLPPMELDHMLSFEEGGASAGFFVEVEREWVSS
jgi:transcription initiation factor IIF auxiliary subunit